MIRQKRHKGLSWAHAYLGIVFVLTLIALIAIIGAAFGAPFIPPFPFQNVQQLGPGIPGWVVSGPPQMGICDGGNFELILFQYTTGDDFDKTMTGFQVYVSTSTPGITAAYFAGTRYPMTVYFGTVNEANGHITITESALYDPKVHLSPCDRWK